MAKERLMVLEDSDARAALMRIADFVLERGTLGGDRVEDLAYRYALMNGLNIRGRPVPALSWGAIMSSEPELRKRAGRGK